MRLLRVKVERILQEIEGQKLYKNTWTRMFNEVLKVLDQAMCQTSDQFLDDLSEECYLDQ